MVLSGGPAHAKFEPLTFGGDRMTEASSASRPTLAAVIDDLLTYAHADAPSEGPAQMRDMEPVLAADHDGVHYVLLRGKPKRCPSISLSSRELEIARMISRGHTNRTVAAVLEISPWTVSTHVRRVFAKLGVGSRAAMVATLVSEGLLDGRS
jgi:DNA-binding CsgD family transcriptional regulator